MIDLFVTFALIASGTTANKYLLGFMPPTFFTAIRMLIAGIILTSYHLFTARRPEPAVLKTDVKLLFFISFFTTFIPLALKAFALTHLNSSQAALLGSIDPFVTALYSYILLSETLTMVKFLGLCGGTFGIAYQTLAQAHRSLSIGYPTLSLPELAIFVQVILSRYGWMHAQKLLRTERYKPSELNGIMMITGGTYALIFAYFLGECGWCTVPHTIQFWGSVFYTIIIGNIIAYTLYSRMLHKHSATLVSLAGLTVPLFVHLYGPITFGEPLSLHFIVALCIIAISLAIFYSAEIKRLRRQNV